MHRLTFKSRKRESFKAFSSTEIENQSQLAFAVQEEVESFDVFMRNEDFPTDLEDLKRNTLQTTLPYYVILEHTAVQEELLQVMANIYFTAALLCG